MKTLVFFRHGKSDWSGSGVSDQERALNERGERTARAMGRFLERTGQVPRSAIISSAVRARATFDLASAGGEWECRVRATEALYDSTPDRVLAEIQQEDDGFDSLLLVGHEPTWSKMIGLFIGGGDIRFTTGALARVDLDIRSWQDASYASGNLIWLVPPKLFAKGDFDFI